MQIICIINNLELISILDEVIKMSMSSNLKVVGKYLDQPAFVKRINKIAPAVLVGAALAYDVYDTNKTPEKDRKNKFIQNTAVLTGTVASALLATKGLKVKNKEIIEGLIELPETQTEEIEAAMTKVKNANLKPLLKKLKDEKLLKLSEVSDLKEGLDKEFKNKNVLGKLIADPEDHNPFGELKDLSLLGLIPVIGGVTGGIVGDKLTKQDWKKNLPNKAKEGVYQYLNNIFLCNIGAGVALGALKAMKVDNKAAKFFGMIGGVVASGLVAGNAVANFVDKNIVAPLFDKTKKPKDFKSMFKDLNKDRHPEAIDLGLHVDDLASVGFISGLKVIGPILPMLYSISGYRSGIGYRNGEAQKQAPQASQNAVLNKKA